MYENYNLDSGKIECMYKFYVIIFLHSPAIADSLFV